jgi:hypothetical protein
MANSGAEKVASVEAKAALDVMNAHTRDWGVADVIELIDVSNPGLAVDEIQELTREVVAAQDKDGYAWLFMIVAEEVQRYLENTPPPQR